MQPIIPFTTRVTPRKKFNKHEIDALFQVDPIFIREVIERLVCTNDTFDDILDEFL